MATNKTMMIFIEQRKGDIQKVSFELLGEARRLLTRHEKPWTLTALVIGDTLDDDTLRPLIEHGADQVICCEDASLKAYDTLFYTDAIEKIVNDIKPEVFLIGGTILGRDLAPRVSARLHTGLTADATHMDFEAESESDILQITRPAFGGNLFATIVCENHKPQMASIRPGVFEPLEQNMKNQGEIERIPSPPSRVSQVKTLKSIKKEAPANTIDEARIIVSAGRGVKSCLDLVKDVADHFQGEVGASRALVDEGLIDKPSQIGQTGSTVRPVIYLACGISGAIQHVAGMDKSETVIAINTDEAAPIFNVADLGIIGDAKPILHELKTLMGTNSAHE